MANDDQDEQALENLACLSLATFRLNQTEIELQELRKILHNYLQERPFRDYGTLKPEKTLKSILNLTRSAEHVMIMNDSVCIRLKNQSKLELEYLFFWQPAFEFFIFKENTYDFAKMGHHSEVFDQLIVFNEGPPYVNSCSKNFSRFHCLNDCFKSGFRRSAYFYFTNETGSITLNKPKNRTVRAHEEGENLSIEDYVNKHAGFANLTFVNFQTACFKRCNQKNCKLVYLNPNRHSMQEEVYRFKAKPMISTFDFRLQLVGLASLILDLSFNRLVSLAIQFANSKFRSERAKSFLFYFKILFLIVGLLVCTSLFVRMIIDCKTRIANPARKETTMNLMRPDLIRLCVCIPVNETDYESKTMEEFEETTDGALDDTIERISLVYLGKSMEANWTVTSKVLFKSNLSSFLQRCFQIDIRSSEPQHQVLLSISKLKIKFKPGSHYELFLLAENENLNADSFAYTGQNAFIKRTKKRSRWNGCVDRETVYDHLNCSNRRNCIENCIARRFFDRHQSFSTGSFWQRLVIDKGQFNQSEWSTGRLSFIDSGRISNDEQRCKNQIRPVKLCTESKIDGSVRISQPNDNSKELDLYYNVIRSVEDDPDLYKLIIELLNVLSIVFGLTVPKLLKLFYGYFHGFIRVRANRNHAKFLPLIHLIALTGFSWHAYHIVEVIVNGQLTSSQHYEVAERLPMPEYIFCFQYNTSLIDKNDTLTGNDLEKATREMTAEKIFKSIAYLNNQTDEWIILESNFSTKTLMIESFYFTSSLKWSGFCLPYLGPY